MPKKNTQHHSFETVYPYENLFRNFWYLLVFIFSHWPSLMIHVFTRKNMGERYYTFMASLSFIILLSLPFLLKNDVPFLVEFEETFNWFAILFILVFLGFSIMRRLEFHRNSTEFDPEKYSKYKGDRIVYKWAEEKFAQNNTIIKILESQFIFRNFESLLFILGGLILLIFPFAYLVGILFIVSGLLNMLKTNALYSQGRDYVLDQYDNLIASREFKEAFVHNKSPQESNYLDLSHLPRSKNRKDNEMLADMINAQSVQPFTIQQVRER